MLFVLVIPVPFFQINSTLSATTTNNSVSTAINIKPNTITKGTLTSVSSIYYNISIPSPLNFMVNLSTGVGNSFSLTIDNPNGTQIGTNTSLTYPETLPLNTTGGTYTIIVSAIVAPINGGFSLGIGPQGPQPGQNLAHALSIIPNGTLTPGFLPFNQYYNVSIPSNGYYLFAVYYNSSAFSIQYSVSTSTGTIIGRSLDNPSPVELPLNITAGNYSMYIGGTVGGGSPAHGTFNITVSPYSIHTGEDLAHANQLSLNSTISGSLPTSRYFNFTLPKTSQYMFNISATLSTYFLFEIFSSSGGFLNQTSNNIYPVQLVLNLTAGNYYAEVYSYMGYGPFNFGAYVYTAPRGNSLANPIRLPFDKIVTGIFPSTQFLWQYLNVTVPTTGYFHFNLTAATIYTNYTYAVYNNNGSLLATPSSSTYPQDLTLKLTAGSYFVEVNTNTASILFSNYYNISIHLIKPGEQLFTAIPLPLNTVTPGSTPYNIYYNLTIPITGNYQVSMNLVYNTTNIDFSFEIWSSSGKFVGGPLNAGYPKQADVYLTGGSYYIQFTLGSSPASSEGNFSYIVQTYNPTPGENLANAIQVPINSTETGSLTNYMVYFNFTVSQTGEYYFYGNTSFSISFTIQNSQGQYFYNQLNPVQALSFNSTFPVGSYFMIVGGNVASALFTLTFSNKPISIQSTTPQPGSSNSTSQSSTMSSNSTTVTSQTLTSRETVSTSPFSSIDIILLATISLAVLTVLRRKKH